MKRHSKEEKLNFISNSLFNSLLFAVNSTIYDEDEDVPFIVLAVLSEQIKDFLNESGFVYDVQRKELKGSDNITAPNGGWKNNLKWRKIIRKNKPDM